jgi:hypothetical protein
VLRAAAITVPEDPQRDDPDAEAISLILSRARFLTASSRS